MAPEGFFLDGRFCLLHRPPAAARAAVLYLHPFAEEMNRARRIAALHARELAAAGYLVLQLDLHGCGDSHGDFAEASWEGWLADADAGARYLRMQTDAPLCLWGLRSGALLASAVAHRLDAAVSLLLWQPPVSGRQLLQQFLRLEVAAAMLAGGKTTTEALLARLSQGETLEIAGYGLSPQLAAGLADGTLEWPAQLRAAACLELGSEASPALLRQIAGRSAVSVTVVPDPQFWLANGIADAPALRAASLAAIEAMLP